MAWIIRKNNNLMFAGITASDAIDNFIAITKYEGHAIVSKFELLKAYTIGKKEGIEAFQVALDFVATNYPNTEEGKKAMEVIETIKSKI